MSNLHPYRENSSSLAREVLTFYPWIPVWGWPLRWVGTIFKVLAISVSLLTFQPTFYWLTVPLLFLMVYITRGERYEVEVSELEIVLRRELWPWKAREWHIPRGEVSRIFLEEYDGDARLLLEMRQGQKFPLTEAFSAHREHMHAIREHLDTMIFSHSELSE